MRVELMPSVPHGEVVTSLRASIGECRSIKAAVAFWCVGAQQVDGNLAKRFGGAGFLCVDIHLPTDIDCLAGLVRAGANVYLHLKHPMPQPRELKTGVPPYLLHPKLLLFDRQDGFSELWVGSHNWTARSLTGVNIESSLRLLDVPRGTDWPQARLAAVNVARPRQMTSRGLTMAIWGSAKAVALIPPDFTKGWRASSSARPTERQSECVLQEADEIPVCRFAGGVEESDAQSCSRTMTAASTLPAVLVYGETQSHSYAPSWRA